MRGDACANRIDRDTLKLLSSQGIRLEFVPYKLSGVDPTPGVPFFTGHQCNELWRAQDEMGFEHSCYIAKDWKLDKLLQKLEDIYTDAVPLNEMPDYDFDGIVFKFNHIEHRQKLGDNGKYPAWAIAYKPDNRED